MVSRKRVQQLLGIFWIVDGLLQLKPEMFTPAFVKSVIFPTAQGQPPWIAHLVVLGGRLAMEHIGLWNLLFALVQLALGLGLLFNFRVKQVIIASLCWSGVVWVFGEGLGQVFTGQSILVNGAPGAAVIYGLVGISIWPRVEGEPTGWRDGCVRFAQVALAVLWAAGFVMHLQPLYLSPRGFAQVVSVSWLVNLIGSAGGIVSALLGVIELFLAVLLVSKRHLNIAAWTSIFFSLAFWWIGQSFGQVAEPLSTDPNSGPLMVLLAVCANPSMVSSLSQRRWHMKVHHLR